MFVYLTKSLHTYIVNYFQGNFGSLLLNVNIFENKKNIYFHNRIFQKQFLKNYLILGDLDGSGVYTVDWEKGFGRASMKIYINVFLLSTLLLKHEKAYYFLTFGFHILSQMFINPSFPKNFFEQFSKMNHIICSSTYEICKCM